jgi:hypothetical protein
MLALQVTRTVKFTLKLTIQSVVLVHHVDGHPYNSWATSDCFWPYDILPTRLPDARIWCLAHNLTEITMCSEDNEDSITPIAAVANNFIVDFTSRRRQDAFVSIGHPFLFTALD